ncbi:BTAD domain-containing putative transcriptional regulator [Streptomyces sp. NPDC059850]|uniref:AfsR/SARP family transcriptional regulator n=1 Tax=Streptomyces sp. NPDC059850 TaxID=3346970 RepID=UPI00365C01C9
METRKRRALLSLLALDANRVVSMERLVNVLWEGAPPKHARTVVHGHISALRQALGPRVSIETCSPGYALTIEADRVDAHRFTQLVDAASERTQDIDAVVLLREALALWRGQILTDVAGCGSWHDLAIPWEDARLNALEALAERLRHTGRPAEAVAGLRSALVQHPLRETLAAQLMACLHGAGRQVEALDVYDTVRRRLADELGLYPGPELRQAHAALLRQDTATPARGRAEADWARHADQRSDRCCQVSCRPPGQAAAQGQSGSQAAAF